MKKVILFALVVSWIIITTLTNSSLANGQNELIVFTELSSTELTATNGGVTYVEPDHWRWTPPQGHAYMISSNNRWWVEPENANLGNRITLHFGATSYYDIRSDYDVTQLIGQAYNDGDVIPSEFTSEYMGNFFYYDAQFFDQGDAGTPVPEPTTMLLLGSGLLGLWGFRKKFQT